MLLAKTNLSDKNNIFTPLMLIDCLVYQINVLQILSKKKGFNDEKKTAFLYKMQLKPML